MPWTGSPAGLAPRDLPLAPTPQNALLNSLAHTHSRASRHTRGRTHTHVAATPAATTLCTHANAPPGACAYTHTPKRSRGQASAGLGAGAYLQARTRTESKLCPHLPIHTYPPTCPRTHARMHKCAQLHMPAHLCAQDGEKRWGWGVGWGGRVVVGAHRHTRVSTPAHWQAGAHASAKATGRFGKRRTGRRVFGRAAAATTAAALAEQHLPIGGLRSTTPNERVSGGSATGPSPRPSPFRQPAPRKHSAHLEGEQSARPPAEGTRSC